MSKNKKVIIGVLILIVVAVLVYFSPKLIKRLTGNVNGATKEVSNEFINSVCGKNITSDYFITLSGKIIQDFGDSGAASINIKSDNVIFTKEIEVKSNEYTEFNYALPKGNYVVTITKDGYKTYETEVSDTKNLTITLNSNNMSEIIASGRTYYNTYYDFYDDGTLHLKAVGDFATSSENNDDFLFSVFLDATVKYLNKNGLNIEVAGDYSHSTSDLNVAIISMLSAVLADTSQDGINGRDEYRKALSKIESGECTASNLSDSNCSSIKSLYDMFGVNDFETGKKVIELIVNMPVPTNLIIDDNVSYIPNMAGAVADEVNINDNVFLIERCALMATKFGTLTLNSSSISPSMNFLGTTVSAKINNLIIGNKMLVIPELIFSSSIIDNVYISDSVMEIQDNAFEDATLNGINLPNNLQSIGSNAFSGTNLTTIVFPKSLKTIGSGAFEDSSLEDVTFSEGLTSISSSAFKNTKLRSIVFPKTLETIGNNAFEISSLENVTFSEGLKSIGEGTFMNTKLRTIVLPKSLETIGNSAFEGSSLEDVTFATGLKSIGERAFMNTKLISIVLPDTLKTIGKQAFQFSNLETVLLPESLESIGSSAFLSNKITRVTIPASISNIGIAAFSGNPIKEVTILGDETRFNSSWTGIGFPASLKPSN